MSIILALRSPGRKNTGEPLSSRVARLHKRLCFLKKKSTMMHTKRLRQEDTMRVMPAIATR